MRTVGRVETSTTDKVKKDAPVVKKAEAPSTVEVKETKVKSKSSKKTDFNI